MHLPLLPRTVAIWGQLGARFPRTASGAALSVLTPLLLGGAIAPAAVLLSSQPAQARSAETIMIQRSLREGDRGADVLQLQQALVQRGLLNVNIPRNVHEGYFGPATKAALQEFQRSERDLQVDGILGEATFRRLFAMGDEVPTETYAIALMQAQLSELGYYGSRLDGEFGQMTERALQNFRDETFIPIDTRAGGLDNTFEAVSGYYDQQRQRQDLPHPDVLEARVERQLPERLLWSYGGRWNSSASAVSVMPETAEVYRAIVPLGRWNNQSELSSLRNVAGSVVVVDDHYLGRHAQVGAYGERRNAEERVASLRSQGFDARVVYN